MHRDFGLTRNFPVMRQAVKLRYALFPYIYTMARNTYDSGIGICRPLYYEYPEINEAYSYEGEYFFGNDILVAPITQAPDSNGISKKEIWFPEGDWWCVDKNELITGPCTKTMYFNDNDIPYFFKSGSLIPFNPPTVKRVTERPESMILNIVSGNNGTGSLYEDSGDNSDYDTEYATTLFTHYFDDKCETVTIHPREGNCSKLANTRSWNLRILNARQPHKISINNKIIAPSHWRYEQDTHILSIEIPSQKCDKVIKTIIQY